MELNIKTTVVSSPEQVSSQLDNELVILDTKNGGYFGLNEVGSRIWSLMQTPILVSSIRDTLLDEYEVGQEELEMDIINILSALQDVELIQIVNETVA